MRSRKGKPQGSENRPIALEKCPTGIRGLDEMTFGGLPRGRPTLICGGAGCGKTLLGIEFLVRGVTEFNEPGVCISFEEKEDELAANAASLGFDIPALVKQKKLAIDHVYLERSLIEEAGEYDLEALFVRIGYAVDSIGAKRVLLDSVEALFAGLQGEGILRSELRRLFRWLKDRKLTCIITGEQGQGTLTRYGLEEYISDCVILLDHRTTEGVLTRRLRVVKYRGSTHGTNEYPFLIESDGINIFPVTSIALEHSGTTERISSGVPALDEMLGGKGYYRGTSVLISGTAGTGKTSLGAHFVDAACARGEKCIFLSFEESGAQIARNMRSIGIQLSRWIERGLLHIEAVRPTTFGLEMHLVRIHKLIDTFNPEVVVVDPITALLHSGATQETRLMLLRLIDYLKGRGVTALMTSLTSGGDAQEQTTVEISSLVDAWLLLRDIESGGERNRGIYVLKARGIAHSNQIREFLLTPTGVELREVYLGNAGLVTGSARVLQEAKDRSEALMTQQEVERKQLLLDQKRKILQAQIAALELELEAGEQETRLFLAQGQTLLKGSAEERSSLARSRLVDRGSQKDNGTKNEKKRRGVSHE
jgi:circadian clock protein KaiC